jgi:hypothetical protein
MASGDKNDPTEKPGLTDRLEALAAEATQAKQWRARKSGLQDHDEPSEVRNLNHEPCGPPRKGSEKAGDGRVRAFAVNNSIRLGPGRTLRPIYNERRWPFSAWRRVVPHSHELFASKESPL